MFTAIDNSQQDLLFDHMKKVLQRFDDSQVTSNLPLQGKNIKLQKLVMNHQKNHYSTDPMWKWDQ